MQSSSVLSSIITRPHLSTNKGSLQICHRNDTESLIIRANMAKRLEHKRRLTIHHLAKLKFVQVKPLKFQQSNGVIGLKDAQEITSSCVARCC